MHQQVSSSVEQTPPAQPTLQGVPAADAAAAAARAAQHERLTPFYAQIIARYGPEQQQAIQRLYVAAQTMLDTSGGSTCGKLLLGLYNGTRFRFDLTDLRLLDSSLFEAAMVVLRMDARHTYTEVHEVLNAMYADGRNVGAEFEHWAHLLRLKNRCKREHLSSPKEYGPQWKGVQ
ncbi:DUF7673 family protein [Ramlibacter sp. Leaf400]|uniref:DUF7673 family protein n=1 Tax=Ramlibacter sp. Leaf400 TaxID=1736365 RepID=UPI0006FE4CEF|nr:hypothetical protein [Ramlibacter sp. Leaf400]KQT10984.1 hypothetical protein ASG30_09300 [Ramlibacter sp. Leaf400]